MQTNIVSQSADSSFSWVWHNPITNFLSNLTSFWSTSTASNDLAIPHEAIDIQASALTQPIVLEEASAPITIAVPDNTPAAAPEVLLAPMMDHPFIDKESYLAAREKAQSELAEKKQVLAEVEAKLKDLAKNRFNGLENAQLYLAALQDKEKFLPQYMRLKGEEEKLIFENAIREGLLARLSIDNDEHTTVTTQIVCIGSDKPNCFFALTKVSSGTKCIEGVLCGEDPDRTGHVQILHYVSNEDLKHASSKTLLQIFPEDLVHYLQQRVHTL
jgi:hypothetical protein